MIERYRKQLYCQKGFLKKCISGLESEANPSKSYWARMKNLMTSKDIDLCLDYSHEEFNGILHDIDKRRKKVAKKGCDFDWDPMEQFIFDLDLRRQNGELKLHLCDFPDCSALSNGDNAKLNSLFFLDEDEERCKKIRSDYGVLAFGTDPTHDPSRFFLGMEKAIHKGDDSNSWKTLFESSRHPCNSLIIVDNYILIEQKKAEENLKILFDALLPDSLADDIRFQILIVTKLRKGDKDIDCIKERECLTNTLLKKIRPRLKFDLCILKSQDFHDRIILTNTAFITCGGGFELFYEGKANKTTTINAYCAYFNINDILEWVSDAYSYYLYDVAKVYKSTNRIDEKSYIKYSFPNYYYGHKTNRIVEQALCGYINE